MCVGIRGWRHQCSSFSEITKREGYSWARCQRVSVVSSRSQCGCQAQNMSNILIVFTSIKVLHGSVTWRCDRGRPLYPLTFYPAVILDQAVVVSGCSLPLWSFSTSGGNFSIRQPSEHRHTCAATVQHSCISSGNLGLDFALGWPRCKSRTFVLAEVCVSAACTLRCVLQSFSGSVAFFTCLPLGSLCPPFKPSRWSGIFTEKSSPNICVDVVV